MTTDDAGLSVETRLRALELAFISETIARANPQTSDDARELMRSRGEFWYGVAEALGDDTTGLAEGMRRLANIVGMLGAAPE